MATITINYVAIDGNSFTADDFNNIWPNAVITIQNNEIVTAMLADDSVTAAKLAADVAGVGLTQGVGGELNVTGAGGVGLKGYNTQALTDDDVTLVANVDKLAQNFTGTLTGSVSIIGALTGSPTNGDTFELALEGLVLSGGFTLSLKSGPTTVYTITDAGTYTGNIMFIYTGSAWKIHGQPQLTVT